MFTPSSGSLTSLSASTACSRNSGSMTELMLAVVSLMLPSYALLRELGRVREESVVSLVLETVRELGAALLRDTAVDEDVYEIRLDVPQDSGVVRDQHDAESRRFLRAVHAFGDDLERVDVEA